MTEGADNTPTSRLFFALWPGEQLQTQLLQWQSAIVTTGKKVPKERLHLTLVFLGDTPQETVDDLLQTAAQIDHPAFELTLDSIGYFKRPRILWVGPSAPPNSVFILHQKIAAIVQACGLSLPPEEFKPHITLARKAERPDDIDHCRSLNWRVEEFCLVESHVTESGPEYRVIKTFPLRTGA